MNRSIARTGLAALALAAGGAQAATFTVTTLGGEAGNCADTTCTTIRAAVEAANETLEHDSIQFAAGLRGTVPLEFKLTIHRPTTIEGDTDGDGIADITLSGGNAIRVIEIHNNGVVTLNRLNIADASVEDAPIPQQYGGAIRLFVGSLTLNRVRISNSRAQYGGGIFNHDGAVTVNDSTFDGNVGWLGGAYAQARYTAGSTQPSVTFNRSTLSDNLAFTGGGIYGEDGFVTLNHTTITGNWGGWAGHASLALSGTATIRSSIVANGTGALPECSAADAVIENSLIGDGSCGVVAGENGNLTGDPMLGPLGHFGGATPTHLPLSGSPVVDAVACNAIPGFDNADDQRGVPRPYGVRCDLGSVERRGDPLVTTQADNTTADGQCSLREAIANVNAGTQLHPDCDLAERDVPIRFAPQVENIVLAGTPLLLAPASGDLIIDGSRPGQYNVILDAANQSRVFTLQPGAAATLRQLEMWRGNASDGGAMLVGEDASATLRHVVAFDNAANYGGGVYNLGTLDVSHSLFTSNDATTGGGAIHNGGGASARIGHSAFYSNHALAAGGAGGGFDNNGSALIEHSTFGNNSANTGGGIANRSTLTLAFATLKDSTAANGAISNSAGGNTRIYASSISGTTGASGDCHYAGGTQQAWHTLIGTGDTCLTNSPGTNLSGDPLLAANSAQNGGATNTYRPLPGSPLVDAAPCDLAPETVSHSSDQRDVERPQGSQCDIGAVEVGQHLLTVVSTGEYGGGRVNAVSSLAPFGNEISCPTEGFGACSAKYSAEGAASQVTLTPVPFEGSVFLEWSGACSGSGACVVTMNQARHVQARFGGSYVETLTVTTLDGGLTGACTAAACTLRDAVAVANVVAGGPQTIVFAPALAGGSIGLHASLVIQPAGALTIDGDSDGDGVADITLSGLGARRAIHVTEGADVQLVALNFVDGKDVAGGALYNAGTLALERCRFTGNTATNSGGAMENAATGQMTVDRCAFGGNTVSANGGRGGAFYNAGALRIDRATASGNAAWNGGAFDNTGTLRIDRSTLSGNAAMIGSGIRNTGGSVTLAHATLHANNHESELWTSGGIFVSGGQATLIASVVSGSTGDAADCMAFGEGTVIAHGTVIESGETCDVALVADAMLGTLADHGGDFPTNLPQPGSPLIDAVACDLAAIHLPDFDNAADQRGVARGQGLACDIGAVEVRQVALAVEVTGPGRVFADATPVPNGDGIAHCTASSGQCLALYSAEGTTLLVALNAEADADAEFIGWGGDCTGTEPAALATLDQDRLCTAEFYAAPGKPVDVSVSIGNGRSYTLPGEALLYRIVVRNDSDIAVHGIELGATLPPILLDPLWACIPASAAYCDPAEGSGAPSSYLDLPAHAQATIELSAIAGEFEDSLEVSVQVQIPPGYADANPEDNHAVDIDLYGSQFLFSDGFE